MKLHYVYGQQLLVSCEFLNVPDDFDEHKRDEKPSIIYDDLVLQ